MIGLDTNVLIRYLTQDDPVQAERAARVIEVAEPGSLFVSGIVVCETVWVLEEAYGHKRSAIADVLEQVLSTGQFAFEDRPLLLQALSDYRAGKGDLSDYLIGRVANRAGCTHTLTFDRALKGHTMFRLL